MANFDLACDQLRFALLEIGQWHATRDERALRLAVVGFDGCLGLLALERLFALQREDHALEDWIRACQRAAIEAYTNALTGTHPA